MSLLYFGPNLREASPSVSPRPMLSGRQGEEIECHLTETVVRSASFQLEYIHFAVS